MGGYSKKCVCGKWFMSPQQFGDHVSSCRQVRKNLIDCLEWFVDQDDTWDIASNGPWVVGLEKARKAIADANRQEYEPLDWENQMKSVMVEIEVIKNG